MGVEFQSILVLIRDAIRIARGSIESQSETISDIQVESWIHQYRSLLLKQDLDKGKDADPSYIQEIKGLKLSPIDISEIPTKPVKKYVLKTNLQIPKLIDLNYRPAITYIGTPDGRELQYSPQSSTRWSQYKYYTQNDPSVYLKNQYLYVEGGDTLEYIDIRGVFELPLEVARFLNPTFGLQVFDVSTYKYPIPLNMLPTLKDMIMQKEFGIMLRMPSDTKNDSENSLLNEKQRT